MRTIPRTPAPDCLAAQSSQQEWKHFIGTQCHVAVDAHLRQNQQALCGYCEMGITTESDHHLEHMEPRRSNPKRTYDESNLLSSCHGGTGEHCGHYKDNRHKNRNFQWNADLFASPYDPATAGLFQYRSDGSIQPTMTNTPQADYMIGYLGLNSPRLVERRTQHARMMIDTLGEQPAPDVIVWLQQKYLKPDANGQLQPFYSLSKTILDP